MAVKDKPEFGKRCQLCFKYRRARMYYAPIDGKYIRLCQSCWEEQEELGKFRCEELCVLGNEGHCGRTQREYWKQCEKRFNANRPQRYME